MNKIYSIASVLFTLTVIFACDQKKQPESASSSDSEDSLRKITVVDNISYRKGCTSCKLDMAMPQNFDQGKLLPAIVIVHGGGWRAGSKEVAVYRRLLINYAFQGYVTLSVEYRLTGEAPFPTCVEDVKCAVRWLRAHAKEYNVDSERIGAYGHSAGAHIVLMLAMTNPADGLEGDGGWSDYSSHLNAVIGGSTPVEPSKNLMDWNKPAWWPVGHISAKVPPMLLIHGTKDEAVDVRTVDLFVEKMKKAGAPINYIRIDEGKHGVAYMDNLDITDPAMTLFFEKWLKKNNQ